MQRENTKSELMLVSRLPKTHSRTLPAMAVGALAVGAIAVGALAIGRLMVGRARIRRLEIDELVVRKLRITETLHYVGSAGKRDRSAP
jgi:hypothetical protein